MSDTEARSVDMSVSSTVESQRIITPPSSQAAHDATLMMKSKGEESDKVIIDKASISVPPHLNVNIVSPTPPKITGLPSLKQLTDKYSHSPLSADTHPPPLEEVSEPSTDAPGTAHPEISTQHSVPATTPPKLKVAINFQTNSVQTGSPFTTSPSGRLKLPMSAMTRSHSSSSTSSLSGPPVAPIPPFRRGSEDDKTLTPIEKNTDPFGPVSSTAGPSSGSMSRGSSTDGYIKGYKDVPSLAAIRERVSYSKASGKQVAEMLKDAGKGEDKENVMPNGTQVSISVTGTMTPPPKAQGPEHPLQHSWTLYFDAKSLKPDLSITAASSGRPILGDYEKSLVTVGEFATVEAFARHVNNIKLPSSLSKNSNYHLFKNGIRPMWEDPANANGGKWVVLFKNAPALLDHSWANLTMALVGEMLDPDDEVCGVVASTKPKVDRIQVWTRGRNEVDRINQLGKRIVEVLALEGRELECMSMEFQYNISNPNPPPNLFLSIPFGAPRSTSFSGAQPHPHAPPTPSKLGFNVNASPNASASPRLSHPSLPAMPKSPTLAQGLSAGFANLPKPPRSTSPVPIPRSPTSTHGRLGAPGREVRRLSAGSAFAGPMGGAAKSGMMKREVSAGAGPVAAGIR